MEKYKFLKFDEFGDDASSFLTNTLSLVNLQFVGALTDKTFANHSKITKDTLSKVLCNALKIVDCQSKYIENLENQAHKLKSEVIVNQGTVIDLQKDLIVAKDQQLNDLKATVVASVEDTVKSELKSYSDAVKTVSSTPGVIVDRKTLTSVVQDVVSEEDRSRNIIMFGLKEAPNEKIDETVSKVLLELGEKPTFEASRIGAKSSKDAKKPIRPVKVTLASSTIVKQILGRARALRHSELFKEVFISPDRSVEQRQQQKQLVLELKKKVDEEPNKRHYIKGGLLYSVDKQ